MTNILLRVIINIERNQLIDLYLITRDIMQEKNKYSRRLNIIEGQVKGIRNMIDENRSCNDILVQISAIDRSLKSLGQELFKEYLSNTVVSEVKKDNLLVLDNIIDLCNMIK